MKCPNCGQESDYPRHCPNCGQSLKGRDRRTSAILVAIFLVLPTALIGSCAALVGSGDPRSSAVSFTFVVSGIAFVICLAGIFLVVKLWRS